ncbi:hypothetical protein PHMEG_00016472 [Phytophthora megakarya]|uniref:GAG-pre-integrase domain-containing protein n=1 Tax=Phytophthora megakarya TaxID=4795 RepID=A0A225VYY7_9STRA|nr:hypothetical protein PHMEG_00016472 [Phytophthora megakarya]
MSATCRPFYAMGKYNENGKVGNQSQRNNNYRKGSRYNQRGGNSKGRNKFHGRRYQWGRSSDSNDHGIIAIPTINLTFNNDEFGLAAGKVDHDPMWTIDSGCARQMKLSPSRFENPTEFTIKPIPGNAHIITLNIVFYVPELKFNLLSVRHIVESSPYANKYVLFFVQTSKFEVKTGEGTRLYHFTARPADTYQAGHMINLDTSENIVIWCERMGHPNVRIVQNLAKHDRAKDMGLSKFNPNQDYFFSSCPYAKSHINPFNKRTVGMIKFPLENVHTDMAGPPVAHAVRMRILSDISREICSST